jgi:site-specific DNA-adenine methylase
MFGEPRAPYPNATERHLQEIEMTRLKSPLAWLGGKSQLADRIIERMPAHTAYCEVFAGAAWVLFKKPESKVEIINDINRELVTLYRCVKHHLPELVQQFRWLLIARQHLHIETLQARHADRLDFHEVAVWSIEAALKAAFEAGQKVSQKGQA